MAQQWSEREGEEETKNARWLWDELRRSLTATYFRIESPGIRHVSIQSLREGGHRGIVLPFL